MELSGIAVQQLMLQSKVALSMVKQNAQVQQSVADMIASTVSSTRGQNLDVVV